MVKIGWCDTCNVPVLDGRRCGVCHHRTRVLGFPKTELKPIFKDEEILYRQILTRKAPYYNELLPAGLSFYNIMGEVIIDGKKVFRLSFDKKTREWIPRFFKDFARVLPSFHGSSCKLAVEANEYILKEKEKEALNFLERTTKRFFRLPLAVSFSGGKDSVVSLALTKSVNKNFDAIFLNTTVEFQETVDYVREIARLWKLNLIETNPPHDFFHLCEELGPPSIRMKWCCKTQKFSPQNQLINETYPNGVLVINGIRKTESNIRSRFDRVQRNKMIPKQILAFPIINWSSLDVWLYMFWKNIPHNKMYDYGFARIGCWACPEKSLRDFKLVETVHPDLTKRLGQMLENYAKRTRIDNPEAWIRSGSWRSRKTKWTKTSACRSSHPCSLDNEMVYAFANGPHLKRVKEFIRVFGKTVPMGPMTKIDNARIEVALIGKKMHVKLKNPDILRSFQKQITRALNCVGCGACVGTCKIGALRIQSGEIKIDERCVGCLQCVTANGIRMSCVSVNYKPEVLSIT